MGAPRVGFSSENAIFMNCVPLVAPAIRFIQSSEALAPVGSVVKDVTIMDVSENSVCVCVCYTDMPRLQP